MNIIIDIGNTMVKVAIMDGVTIVEELRSVELDEGLVAELALSYGVRGGILCSTRGDMRDSVMRLRVVIPNLMLFDGETKLPIEVHYAPASSLGRDRIALAVGGRELYPDCDLLIVDFGTAITVDLVTREGGFEGGIISPGLLTRFRSLNYYTASLPLCSPTYQELEIARSTQEAIEQGVMNSVSFEVEGYIERFKKKNCELLIIFTGGDAIFFEKRIKNAIFANRDILFRGLNRILEYNAD